MNKSDEAVSLMKSGSSCAQAVLSVFADELEINRKTAHKIMTAFGGGIAKKQYTCGVVSGGVAVLNLRYGSEEGSDADGKTLAYKKVNEFITDVEKKFGYSDCRSFLGYSFEDEKAVEMAKQNNLTEKVCHNILRYVVDYLETENQPVSA